MNAEDLAAAFCVPAEEPWFLAVMAKLDDALEDAAAFVSMPATAQNPGLLAHSAGGLEALRTLREELARSREQSFSSKFSQAGERHG